MLTAHIVCEYVHKRTCKNAHTGMLFRVTQDQGLKYIHTYITHTFIHTLTRTNTCVCVCLMEIYSILLKYISYFEDIHTHTQTHTCVCLCMYVCTHTHTYTHMYAHTDLDTCVYTYIHLYILYVRVDTPKSGRSSGTRSTSKEQHDTPQCTRIIGYCECCSHSPGSCDNTHRS